MVVGRGISLDNEHKDLKCWDLYSEKAENFKNLGSVITDPTNIGK